MMRLQLGMTLGGRGGAAAALLRTASTSAVASVWSGHSLTDAVYFSGTYPGDFTSIWLSVYGGSSPHRKSTIAGSSLQWRWNNSSELVGGISVDERDDAGDFDLLVITEAGAPPRPDVEANRVSYATSLEHLCLFVENAYLNGANGGAETILHTINPYWAGSYGLGFRESCLSYERTFHHMADYAAAWMRREYPAVSSGYRIWVLPCHRFWIRVYDDLLTSSVPGYTDLEDLFLDDIHPNADAGYGLACLAFAMIYQIEPAATAGFFVPSGMSTAKRDYFWAIAWDIATAYQRAGLGGSIVGEAGYVHGVDYDHLAVPASVDTPASISPSSGDIATVYTLTLATWDGTAPITTGYTLTLDGIDITSAVVNTGGVLTWTATAEGTLELTCTADNLAFAEAESVSTALVGEVLPADALLVVTADAMTGIAFSPALPDAAGGFRTLGGTPRTAVLGATAAYYIAVLRLDTTGLPSSIDAVIAAHSSSNATDWWTTDNARLAFSGFTVTLSGIVEAVPEGQVSSAFGSLTDEQIVTFEWRGSGTTHTVSINGGTPVSLTPPGSLTGLNRLSIYAGGNPFLPDVDVAAVLAMDRDPDAGELTAIRGWAAAIRAAL